MAHELNQNAPRLLLLLHHLLQLKNSSYWPCIPRLTTPRKWTSFSSSGLIVFLAIETKKEDQRVCVCVRPPSRMKIFVQPDGQLQTFILCSAGEGGLPPRRDSLLIRRGVEEEQYFGLDSAVH